MKMTINTEVLKRQGMSLGEFLTLLLGYYNVSYKECYDKLIEDTLVCPNLFNKDEMILSDNTRDLVSRILLESSDKVTGSGMDFTGLAKRLQDIFPSGCKPGTTYPWRDKTEVIAQKLMTLVAVYDFSFTEEEAVGAAREYVDSMKEDLGRMQLLKYFLLRTRKKDGEIDSMFMTIIENNR